MNDPIPNIRIASGRHRAGPEAPPAFTERDEPARAGLGMIRSSLSTEEAAR